MSKTLSLSLSESDCGKLASALGELSAAENRATRSLGQLRMLDEQSTHELRFRKSEETKDIPQDYDCSGLGYGTWEAVFYHPPYTPSRLHKVREEFLAWAIPAPDSFEQKVFTQGDGEFKVSDLDEAYKKLKATDDPTYQINLYCEHPLRISYGSQATDAKLWIEDDFSQVILKGDCAWTGNWATDVENYLLYYRLIRTMTATLNPSRIAWGDTADSWPDHAHFEAAALEDEESMWRLFLDEHQEILERNRLPSGLRQEFSQQFCGEITR